MTISRCLQEITYLTSPGALNPLPPRPMVSVLGPASPIRENGSTHDFPPQPDVAASLDRPRKALPDQIVSPMYPKAEESPEPVENGIKEEPKDPSSSTIAVKEELESHPMRLDTTARPPSSPAIRTMGLPVELPQDGQIQENQILTAIYRPESKAAWREELRAANEKAEKVRIVILVWLMSRLKKIARKVRTNQTRNSLPIFLSAMRRTRSSRMKRSTGSGPHGGY